MRWCRELWVFRDWQYWAVAGGGGDCRGSGKFLEGKEGPGPEEPLMCVKVFLVRKKLRLTEEF